MVNTKEVLSALEWITKNGELRDYDDEIANRIEDAKNIVQSYPDLLAAAKQALAHINELDDPWVRRPIENSLHAAIARVEQA